MYADGVVPLQASHRAVTAEYIKAKQVVYCQFKGRITSISCTAAVEITDLPTHLFKGDPAGDPAAAFGARAGLSADPGESPAEPHTSDRTAAPQVASLLNTTTNTTNTTTTRTSSSRQQEQRAIY